MPREHCNSQVWTEQEPEQGVVLHVPDFLNIIYCKSTGPGSFSNVVLVITTPRFLAVFEGVMVDEPN